MKKVRRTLFGTPRRSVFSAVIITALVMGSAAFAAFILFSGASGSAGGKFDSSQQTLGAITITPASGSASDLSPGGSSSVAYYLQGPGNNHIYQIASVTVGAVTTSTPGCDAATKVHPNAAAIQAALTGQQAGNTQDGPLTIANAVSADADLAQACAGGTFSIDLSGTTSQVN